MTVEFPIPIQNLYYLFCYAWNRLEEGGAVDVGGVDSPELADLFATVLISGLKHLIRSGIDRGYIPVEEELSTLRGRVKFQDSMQLMVRRTPRLRCKFDELQHDILTNQILKATTSRLAKVVGIDKELAHKLRVLSRGLGDVSELQLSKFMFRQVQIDRHNAFYDFLIKICELIYDSTLPEGRGDRYRFSDILRDEQKMALVFQDFVRNFLRLEQNSLSSHAAANAMGCGFFRGPAPNAPVDADGYPFRKCGSTHNHRYEILFGNSTTASRQELDTF